MFVWTMAAIVLSPALLGSPAYAEEIGKRCAGMGVQTITVSRDFRKEGLLDATPEKIAVPWENSLVPPATAGKAVTVIINGPILGSMDSSPVKTHLTCSAKGFVLTATITRSAAYHGFSLKNVLWRPRITLAAVLHQPGAFFETVWRMRLSTGALIDHARTPPYPEQTYPITVFKTIHSALIQAPLKPCVIDPCV